MNEMPEHFISLNCANCGAKLDVYDDMDRFSCGYCSTEMVVQRRGGTVALKAVAEAIKKVQIGTDKTAAELALVRLRQDRAEIVAKFSAIKPAVAMPWGCSVVFAASVLALGCWIATGSGLIGMLVVITGLCTLGAIAGSKGDEARWLETKAECVSKVSGIDEEIVRQIEIVSGSAK